MAKYEPYSHVVFFQRNGDSVETLAAGSIDPETNEIKDFTITYFEDGKPFPATKYEVILAKEYFVDGFHGMMAQLEEEDKLSYVLSFATGRYEERETSPVLVVFGKKCAYKLVTDLNNKLVEARLHEEEGDFRYSEKGADDFAAAVEKEYGITITFASNYGGAFDVTLVPTTLNMQGRIERAKAEALRDAAALVFVCKDRSPVELREKIIELIPPSQLDKCSKCHGKRGGVPGNENVEDSGLLVCDYCS